MLTTARGQALPRRVVAIRRTISFTLHAIPIWAIGIALVVVLQKPLGVEIVLALLLACIIAIPVVARILRDEFDVFEPCVLVAAVFLFYFVISPLISLATGTTEFLGRDFRLLYARGADATMVAVVAAWLGYSSPWGKAFGRAVGRWVPASPISTPTGRRLMRRFGWMLTIGACAGVTLWVVLTGQPVSKFLLPGVVATSDTARLDDLQGLNYLFLTLEWFTPAFLILIASGGLRSRLARWSYAFLVQIPFVSLGFRYRLVIFFGAWMTLTYLQRKRRPHVAILVSCALVALLLFGYIAGARSYVRSYGSSGSLETGTATDVFEDARMDTRIYETFLAVLDAVPRRVDHTYWEPITYVFVLPIPREIWPEKPHPSSVDKIDNAIGTYAAQGAGSALPNFGEYYLAFGWVGMVVGMFVFGVGCRALWSFYKSHPDSLWVHVIFSVSLPFIFQVIIRGYLAQIVQEWFFIVFPAAIGAYVARKGSVRATLLSS